MKQKLEPVYDIQVNGMPDYGKIPKATLEPIAKKFLEDSVLFLRDLRDRA